MNICITVPAGTLKSSNGVVMPVIAPLVPYLAATAVEGLRAFVAIIQSVFTFTGRQKGVGVGSSIFWGPVCSLFIACRRK